MYYVSRQHRLRLATQQFFTFTSKRAAALVLCCLWISTAEAQSTTSGCGVSSTTHAVISHARPLLQAIERAPRNAIRPENLKWELPIAAATGVLIAEVDQPAANRIQGKSIQDLSRLWSNIGLGTEIGAGFATWGVGCIEHKSSLRDNGLIVLTAIGAAGTLDLALKLSFDREFPYKPGSQGRFCGGGRSFPSGHAATSFAFAAAVAQRYPHNRWIKWELTVWRPELLYRATRPRDTICPTYLLAQHSGTLQGLSSQNIDPHLTRGTLIW